MTGIPTIIGGDLYLDGVWMDGVGLICICQNYDSSRVYVIICYISFCTLCANRFRRRSQS